MRAGGADEVADPPYAGPCRLGAEVGAGADDGTPGRGGAEGAGVGRLGGGGPAGRAQGRREEGEGGAPPVVGEGLQRGGDAVEDPRGARHEASRVLEDEDLWRVLAQQRQGREQEGEGGDEVRVGHRAVESRELDAGEAPEGEVVGEGREGALVQDVSGE